MFNPKLSFFHGPIDLLLYLVRKNEIDILNVPIASVMEQYLEYISVLEQIDVNVAVEFLSFASILIEIKSFAVLPGEESVAEEFEDPRKALVGQLIEYKKFCDAANKLELRSERWQLRFPRFANDLPPRPRNMIEEPIKEVELWDIVSAFGRILRENSPKAKHEIIYDDTPISTWMQQIHRRLHDEERVPFRQLLTAGQHKTGLIGIFLASLELVRHEYAYIYQDCKFGEIELAHRNSGKSLDFANLNFSAT
ncbi:MAG: segregation/condensation protein A [Planctomycetaceae bacterium]|jgi:segregation and condensation protein A|nr:segregation/condensation protein A [Planctomycetaceae bacterium]